MKRISIVKIKYQEAADKVLFLIFKTPEGRWKHFETSTYSINADNNRDYVKEQFISEFNLIGEDSNAKIYNPEKNIDVSFIRKVTYKDDAPPVSIFEIEVSKEIYSFIKSIQKSFDVKWIDGNEINKTTWDPVQEEVLVSVTDGKVIQPKELPEFKNDFLTSIEKIQDAKIKNKLIIFVGAGISKNCGVPDWKELTDKLKEEIDNEDISDSLIIAQTHYNSRGKKEYYQTIMNTLMYKKVSPNDIHYKIFEQSPAHIITTNYDDLLEQVIDEKGLIYSVVKKDSDLPYTESERFLVKMHGDFEQRNIVLKENDYLSYKTNFPLTENFVRGIFSSNTILFLGFSFSDPNLKHITNYVHDILGDDFPPMYLFSPFEMDRNHVDYLKEKKIVPVLYDERINTYLSDNKGTSIKPKKIAHQLTEGSEVPGQKTYNFLEFLLQYDLFSERTKKLDIQKKLYKYFTTRLPSFRCIPYYLYKDLPALKKTYTYRFSDNVLETNDDDILRFVDSAKETFSQHETPNVPIEAKEIINRFQYSIIHYVRTLESYTKEPRKIDFELNGDCDCCTCRYAKFEWNSLIKELNSKIDDGKGKTLDINYTMAKAHSHFQLGNIIECYSLLLSTSTTSFKKGDYVNYFLCNYNIKQLRPFLDRYYVGDDVSLKKLEEIREEIDNINLVKVLTRLPIDRFSEKLLLDLFIGELAEVTEYKMNGIIETIQKHYDNYKKPGYSVQSPYHSRQLDVVFFRLFEYYRINSILKDGYQTFFNLTHKYIDGLFLSYSTDTRYEYKLKEFANFQIKILIEYGDNNKLDRLFKKYQIDSILIYEEDNQSVFDHLISFFNSALRDSYGLVGIQPRESFLKQYNKSYYTKDKIDRIFKNILLIFSKISFRDDAHNKALITKIRDFLTAYDEHMPLGSDYNSFIQFIQKKAQFFDNSTIEKFIEISLSDNLWSDKVIRYIVPYLIKSSNNFRTENRFINEKIFARISDRKRFRINFWDVLPLYPLLSEETQIRLKKQLLEKLEKEGLDYGDFIYNCIEMGIEYNILDPKKDFSMEKYVELILEKYLLKDQDFEIDSKGNITDIKNIQGWNRMAQLVKNQKYLSEDSISTIINNKKLASLFKWILAPNKFNYEYFKPEWLLTYSDKIDSKNLPEIKEIKIELEKSLKSNYNPKLSKIYFEKFNS